MNHVVEIEGLKGKYVIFKTDNREDAGSCSYSRTLYLIPVEDLETMDTFTEDYNFTRFEMSGTRNPVTRTDDVPFKIEKEVKYNVKKATAKTITVYE